MGWSTVYNTPDHNPSYWHMNYHYNYYIHYMYMSSTRQKWKEPLCSWGQICLNYHWAPLGKSEWVEPDISTAPNISYVGLTCTSQSSLISDQRLIKSCNSKGNSIWCELVTFTNQSICNRWHRGLWLVNVTDSHVKLLLYCCKWFTHSHTLYKHVTLAVNIAINSTNMVWPLQG